MLWLGSHFEVAFVCQSQQVPCGMRTVFRQYRVPDALPTRRAQAST